MVEFPNDIVEHILSFLPVIALLRCRCVSRSWRSLISSAEFTRKHLITNKEYYFRNGRILINNPLEFINHCSLSDLYSTQTFKAKLFQYPLPTQYVLVGSSDGLICLLRDREPILWNPSIRQVIPVPDSNVESYYCQRHFGFGFDDASNDYKILGFFTNVIGGSTSLGKIFSFNTGAWKTINSDSWSQFIYNKTLPGIPQSRLPFGNGKCYWICSLWEEGLIYKWLVCCLEIKTEVFRKFEIPKNINKGVEIANAILTLSEQKKLHVIAAGWAHARVWMMKEVAGNGVNWTQLCNIEATGGLQGISLPMCSLYVMSNGDILLQYKTKITIYNPSNGLVRHRNIIISPNDFVTVCPYIESLVWV